MDIPLLNTLEDLEGTLQGLLYRINETRAQQHQLAHDPGLLAWQTEMTRAPSARLAELPPLAPALSEVTPHTRCYKCGVREGMWHRDDCLNEVCPNCLWTVEHCGCLFAPGALGQPRVPFFQEPVSCCHRCHVASPPMFRVSDAYWRAYVPPHWQKEELYVECFVYIIRVTDQAMQRQFALLERVAKED